MIWCPRCPVRSAEALPAPRIPSPLPTKFRLLGWSRSLSASLNPGWAATLAWSACPSLIPGVARGVGEGVIWAR